MFQSNFTPSPWYAGSWPRLHSQESEGSGTTGSLTARFMLQPMYFHRDVSSLRAEANMCLEGSAQQMSLKSCLKASFSSANSNPGSCQMTSGCSKPESQCFDKAMQSQGMSADKGFCNLINIEGESSARFTAQWWWLALKHVCLGWNVRRPIPPGQRWNIQERYITVGFLILHTSTSMFVSTETSHTFTICISHYSRHISFKQHNETNHWYFSEKENEGKTLLYSSIISLWPNLPNAVWQNEAGELPIAPLRDVKRLCRERFSFDSHQSQTSIFPAFFSLWLKQHIKERMAYSVWVDHRTGGLLNIPN